MSDCPRWLLLARHLTHLDPTEIARHHADHERWHRCPHDYDPGYLPREREDAMMNTYPTTDCPTCGRTAKECADSRAKGDDDR